LGRCTEEHAQAARVQKEAELNGPATAKTKTTDRITRQLEARGFTPEQVAVVLAVVKPFVKS
jgi:SOS response regulatory protein OraA/RecX